LHPHFCLDGLPGLQYGLWAKPINRIYLDHYTLLGVFGQDNGVNPLDSADRREQNGFIGVIPCTNSLP
jgi:hypothetical protein